MNPDLGLSLTFSNLPLLDTESAEFTIHGNDNDDLQCLNSYGSLLGNDDVLAQLLSTEGPLEEPDLNGPTTLHCEICSKQFDNAKKYYGHLRVHTKDVLWTCDKCSPPQKFPTKQHLMRHSLTHQPLERVWRCPQCTMSFESLWRLQQHMFSKHRNYRPHKCEICGKTCNKKSDMLKHMAVHSDERKHICTICKAGFKDKSNLKRHMKHHTKEKPYCCPHCSARFTQIASMNRHVKQKCTAVKKTNKKETIDPTVRKNYCRVCGETFQYKSALLEHTVRMHSDNPSQLPEPPKNTEPSPIKQSPPTIQQIPETTRDVNLVNNNNLPEDNIVDDILSAEIDFLRMSNEDETNNSESENNPDLLMQIEYFKDISQLQTLDEELLCSDFDGFQNIDIDSYNDNNDNIDENDNNDTIEKNKNDNINTNIDTIPDLDPSQSLDQDIMNVLYNDKSDDLSDELPDELLNVVDNSVTNIDSEVLQTVSVEECATIFETDVDLEESSNLADNLNQLIGENSVQYISNEDDDTFIINLDSAIDAAQLTDMLNIEVESVNAVQSTIDANKFVHNTIVPEIIISKKEPIQPIMKRKRRIKQEIDESVIKIYTLPKVKENFTLLGKIKSRDEKCLTCSTCKKEFQRKENYISHLATHEPSLRRHKCPVCGQKFSYRSTLNKHYIKLHQPKVHKSHPCDQCGKIFNQPWMLKCHKEREHIKLAPHECNYRDCQQRFYKHSDLVVHRRYHTGEKPFSCNFCKISFAHISHLKRHVRKLH